MSKKLNIPLVATNDVHYLRNEDNSIQDILMCIQMQKTVNETDRMSLMGDNFALKNLEEIYNGKEYRCSGITMWA